MAALRAHNRRASGGAEIGVQVTRAPSNAAVRRKAILEAITDLGAVIYAIQCADGLIKIGHTGNLKHRRSQHGVAFGAILAVIPGSYDDEQALHKQLQQHVAKGREYYHPTPEVLDFVNRIRTRAGIPPVHAARG